MTDADAQASPHVRTAKLSVAKMQELVSEGVPLAAHIGCRVEALAYGSARLSLPDRADLLRPGGTIGGPAMMALADVAIWAAILTMVGPMALAVTTDLTFHFLRKPRPGDLHANARTLQLGRRLAVADCIIAGIGDAHPVAHAVGTYALPEGAG
jgi:uncharacterized protein (TIGR00369 family)